MSVVYQWINNDIMFYKSKDNFITLWCNPSCWTYQAQLTPSSWYQNLVPAPQPGQCGILSRYSPALRHRGTDCVCRHPYQRNRGTGTTTGTSDSISWFMTTLTLRCSGLLMLLHSGLVFGHVCLWVSPVTTRPSLRLFS